MLVRYITRVRRAEPAVRTRHAFFWAVGITGFATVLWALSLPSMLRPLPEGVAAMPTQRPWESFLSRAKEQLAGVSSALNDAEPETNDGAARTDTVDPAPVAGTIELTPADVAAARARAAIDYNPAPSDGVPATTTATSTPVGTSTQPRVVRIATTTSPVATTTATTTR